MTAEMVELSGSDPVSYRVTSRAYLARARARLDEALPEPMFYAAFELRCGIQRRMQDYLVAQEQVAEHRRDGWRIPELAKDFETVFRTGDKVVRLVINAPSGDLALYFTPVTRRLQTMAGRLGKLLHAQNHHPDDHQWWRDQRQFLEQVYVE